MVVVVLEQRINNSLLRSAGGSSGGGGDGGSGACSGTISPPGPLPNSKTPILLNPWTINPSSESLLPEE